MTEEQNNSRSAAKSNSFQEPRGLFSNPESMQALGALIEKLSGETNRGTVSQTIPDSKASADGITELLSNPELMKKLPEIIAAVKPIMGNLAAAPTSEQKREDNAPSNSRDRSRDQLLLSLKPFLSKNRCDAIDTMLRIATLSHVFQQLK